MLTKISRVPVCRRVAHGDGTVRFSCESRKQIWSDGPAARGFTNLIIYSLPIYFSEAIKVYSGYFSF